MLLPEVKLEADKVHVFRDGLADLGAVRFVRLNIIPDGGVSRLRLIGQKGRRGMTSLSTHVSTPCTAGPRRAWRWR